MQAWIEIGLLTIQVSGTALLIACALGLPFGAWLGLTEFPGRRGVQVAVSTAMGLPPVVVGLLVYLLLSRQGSLASLDWLFTPSAMIFAQSILAFPIAAGLTSAAVSSVPAEFVLQVRSLGADDRQARRQVLRQARRGVLAAVLAAFGRIIAEVGAVMLVGGNIAGKTRVLSTAIVLETRQGNFEFAMALGVVLLGLALLANALFLKLERT